MMKKTKPKQSRKADYTNDEIKVLVNSFAIFPQFRARTHTERNTTKQHKVVHRVPKLET